MTENALHSSVAVLRRTVRGDELGVWDCLTNTLEASVALGAMSASVASFVCAQPAKEFIVVGSASGKMVVVDPLAGNIVFRWSSGEPAITSACPLGLGGFATGHSNGRVSIWRMSGDGACCVESTVEDLQCTPVTGLAGLGSSLLAIGQGVISIYDLGAKTTIKTLPGHLTGQVFGLGFCANGTRLVSCAEHDLSVLVWDVPSGRLDPVYSIALPDLPSQLSVSPGGVLLVVCGPSIKLVCGIDGEAKGRVATLKQTSDLSFSADPVLAGHLCKDDRVLTVRGTTLAPFFEYLPLFVEGHVISGVLERPPCSPISSSAGAGKERKKARKTSPEVISGASAPLRAKPDACLQQSTEVAESVVVDGAAGGLTSITNLLVQGLCSRNPDLIESGLKLTDEGMIIESLERLPQSVAFSLLEELVGRIVKRPARVLQLGSWIKCLHTIHGPFITSVHKYKAAMRPLQDCIASHTESQDLLLGLQATVDALLSRSPSDVPAEPSGPKTSQFFVEIIDESDGNDDDDDDDNNNSVSLPDCVSFDDKDGNQTAAASDSDS